MRDYKYIIQVAVIVIASILADQSSIHAQSAADDKTKKITVAQMEKYNCPDNHGCCISSQSIEVIDSKERSDIKTKSVALKDTIITELPIVEVSNKIEGE